MKKPFGHFKTYMFRGLLALIPLALTVLAIRFIYIFIDKKIIELIDQYIGFRVPGLGIVLLLGFLYVIGLIASNVLGKKFFKII